MDICMQESISACVMCQTNGKCAKTHAALLQLVPLPDGPWQKVGIDIVGPFESANWDCRYVATYVSLTMTQSGWTSFLLVPSQPQRSPPSCLQSLPSLATLQSWLVIMGHSLLQVSLQTFLQESVFVLSTRKWSRRTLEPCSQRYTSHCRAGEETMETIRPAHVLCNPTKGHMN